MRPVITIIDRASMIVWLIAEPDRPSGQGQLDLVRIWPPVEPSERAASTVVAGTPRIPSDVIRIAGGIAKIRVATTDGVAPIRNSSVTGVR